MDDALERLVDEARPDLEAAGSPAYLVALVDAGGRAALSPMTFSTPRAARDQAARMGERRAPGERVVVVAREADVRRALFSVFDASVERRLHRRLEIVEQAFAERELT